MDREFMREFYRNFYIHASDEAVKDSEEYMEKSSIRSKLEDEMIEMLGGVRTEEYHKFDQFLSALFDEYDVMLEETYLMGAKDREKMLR